VFGRIADGGAVFQDVHSKSAGSLLQILSHVGTSKLCMLLKCMHGNTRLEARTAPAVCIPVSCLSRRQDAKNPACARRAAGFF